MRGAASRVEREIEVANRQAHNTAALTGGAFVGKMPSYEKAFGRKQGEPAPKAQQAPDVLEANLKALAKAWGAKGKR